MGRLEIIFRIAKFRAADLCFCLLHQQKCGDQQNLQSPDLGKSEIVGNVVQTPRLDFDRNQLDKLTRSESRAQPTTADLSDVSLKILATLNSGSSTRTVSEMHAAHPEHHEWPARW